MRKKIITFAAVIVGVITMVTVVSAFALNPAAPAQAALPEQSTPIVAAAPVSQSLPAEQIAYAAPNSASVQDDGFDLLDLMFDKDGQPVSKDVLEANLEKAIEEGYLNAEDMELIIEMFDYCLSSLGGGEMLCGPGENGFSGCPLSGGW